jgi:DNA-binding IclR family transcriptional regulator
MLDRNIATSPFHGRVASEGPAAVYADTLNDREFATTLARGLFILRSFTPDRPALGNKDLVALTGLPKATISRFTYTLCCLGYLRQVPGQSKYQLSSGVLSLGYPFLATMRFRQLARRQMDDLASEVQGSVAIGVRNGLNMVYIESSLADTGDSPPYTHIGYEHPIAVTSMGHAYVAACTSAARITVMNEMKVKQPDLWRRSQERIEKSLAQYQRLGFCMVFDSYRPGIYGVSVPFPRLIQGELLIFNCTVYADAVTPEHLEFHVAPKLLGLVRRVDESMREPSMRKTSGEPHDGSRMEYAVSADLDSALQHTWR